jgi:hypothetical protein
MTEGGGLGPVVAVIGGFASLQAWHALSPWYVALFGVLVAPILVVFVLTLVGALLTPR